MGVKQQRRYAICVWCCAAMERAVCTAPRYAYSRFTTGAVAASLRGKGGERKRARPPRAVGASANNEHGTLLHPTNHADVGGAPLPRSS